MLEKLIIEKLTTLKMEYYKNHGIKPNVLVVGREDFSNLIKDKKLFKTITVLEDVDKIEDLTILQVHTVSMFKVGYVDM